MEQYDIIWFESSRKDTALDLIKRLDVIEIRARMIDLMQGLRVIPGNAPMPDRDGNQDGKKVGFCMWRNFIGSSFFRPGCIQMNGTRRLEVMDYVEIKYTEPGLVCGNFIDAAMKSKAFEDEKTTHAEAEAKKVIAMSARRVTRWELTVWKWSGRIFGALSFPLTVLAALLVWVNTAILSVLVKVPAYLMVLPSRYLKERRRRISRASWGDPIEEAMSTHRMFVKRVE